MILRLEILAMESGGFEYVALSDGESLYADAGLPTVAACLVSAVEALPPEAVALEVAYGGIVAGTFVLADLARQLDAIAAHASRTTAAVLHALQAQQAALG